MLEAALNTVSIGYEGANKYNNMFGCSHMEIYLGGKHDTDEEHKVGEVRMPCCGGGFKPTLNIQDKKGDTKAVVKGPCCFVSDLCGSTFEVITPDGKTVGDVQKLGIQSAGNAIQEATTDADNFLSLTQRREPGRRSPSTSSSSSKRRRPRSSRARSSRRGRPPPPGALIRVLFIPVAAARPRLAESREAPDLPPIGRGQPPGEDI